MQLIEGVAVEVAHEKVARIQREELVVERGLEAIVLLLLHPTNGWWIDRGAGSVAEGGLGRTSYTPPNRTSVRFHSAILKPQRGVGG